MYLSNEDILKLPRIKRINLINGVTGIKPANLVGTKSVDGLPNVAIFSSVVHLGSHPPLLGFVFRPQHQKPRDTYLNLKATGYYTINQIPIQMVKNAHFTSAKFPKAVSEFERCGFTAEYLFDFYAPFVRESKLKIGLELVEEVPIEANKTIMVVGRIVHLDFPTAAMSETGHLNLEALGAAGISGCDSYYSLEKVAQFRYAHVKDVPEF